MEPGTLLLLVGGLLAVSMAVALGAARLGVPTLVAFLALGMLLGSDGPGGIDFDDAELARTVGIAGLAAILYEGGLSTSWRRLRRVAVPAALLATIGVVATAVLAGLVAHGLFDLSWLEAVLLGAVVASTDAAAVFATLRFTHIRRRVARTLEAETGLNDPVAIALTIGLIDWIVDPTFGFPDLVLAVVQQLALGLVVGVVLGAAAMWAFARLPHSIGAFAPVASVATAALTFGVADTIGGSGFLAVYLVGLAVGSTPSRYRRQLVAFHEGLAFLAQVAMFVVLGLLVFPSELPAVALPGIVLAALLVLVIRPAAVWIATAFSDFTHRERALLGWAGLRGAVPIVLATFVLSSEVGEADTIFNAVFFVVVVSTLVQGTTLEWVAERLDLIDPRPDVVAPPLEVDALGSLELVEFDVAGDHSIAGVVVRELGLPRTALIAVVARGNETIPPRGSTTIESGDRLFVLAPRESRPELEDVFARWRQRV
ncbi:potassium/proton antiporter [Gaiella sp.]|uniref:potassium/proton antiporter n=1 Tax=Gaiella sp. TaxID=2663207 RepID=UPI002E338871|nr:potassium/proton antiporter [Gaiella sp.]HEX5582652.1 potassium/proton antiporter [Gaiella sp.]